MRWGFVGSVLASLAVVSCGGAQKEELSDVVETVEIGDSKADHASRVRATLYAPSNRMGGQRTTLTLRVVNGWGDPLYLEAEHTKLMHLILVSEDLWYFAHLHPSPVGDGRFSVRWTPPQFDDRYHVYAQFKPYGRELQTVRFSLAVPGMAMKTPVPLTPDRRDYTASGSNLLHLDGASQGFRMGEERLTLRVFDARSGDLATDLGTFLGAKAHLIAVQGNAEGRVFLHAHDMGDAGHSGHEGHSASVTSDGALSFDVTFPSAGIYRLWVQYHRGTSDVTQFFTVRVTR